jgi:taurine dioxygenase
MIEIDYKLLNTIDIDKTLLSNGLLVVRNAVLSLDEFEIVANSLGKPVVTYKHILNQAGTIQEISSNELFGDGDLDWHNDLSYGKGNYDGAILYNVKNAQLSPTWFMDMSQLPADMYEKYKDAVGVYRPPVQHTECFTDRQIELIKKQKISRPFVFDHPITNQKLLYCSPGTIQDCDLDLSDIIKYSEEHSYKHQWQEGDLLIWDNLRMMHRRFSFAGERVLWRTQFRPNYIS